VWSPDGRQIAFSNDRTGTWQIYVKDVGGTGQEQLLTDGPNAKSAKDWSRDGRYILYEEQDPKNGADIRALLLDGDHKPIPVLQTPFNEAQPQFSPDGKWIAYQSDESGANQIYVQSFPPSGGKWQISTSGGTSPRWRGDGKELYYYNSGALWAAGIRAVGGRLDADAPKEMFPITFVNGPSYFYDVTRDGQRVLEIQPPDTLNSQQTNPLTVVTNWQAGLKH
jgi:eukaryotic-like serine/threonine-protein kinase